MAGEHAGQAVNQSGMVTEEEERVDHGNMKDRIVTKMC